MRFSSVLTIHTATSQSRRALPAARKPFSYTAETCFIMVDGD
jgi:hypothetical protein